MGRHRAKDGARTLRVDVGRLAALVPVAVLVASTAAVAADSRQDQASAAPVVDTRGLPAVPTAPLTEPGSVAVPGALPDDIGTPVTQAPPPGDGASMVESASRGGTSGGPGIPARALQAYRHAERLLAAADPACRLDWPLVAAIGYVESRHGSFGGNVLDEAGVARPGIIGIALDGSGGTAQIGDSDGGALDRDGIFDRAVGPMQFIPGTWRMVGADAEPDGRRDPQDIDDAAAAAGIYLCSGTGDLSKSSDRYAAVYRYNHSDAYVRQVLAIADSYARGVTELPDGVRAAGRSGDVRALAAPGGRNVDGDTQPGWSAGGSSGAGGPSGGAGGPSGPVMTPVPPPSSGSGSAGSGPSPSGSSKPPAAGGGQRPLPLPTTTSGAGGLVGVVGGVAGSAGGAVGGAVGGGAGGVSGALPGAPAGTSTTTSGSASGSAELQPSTSPTCVNLLGIPILCPAT